MQSQILSKTQRTGKTKKKMNPARTKNTQVVVFRLQTVVLVSAVAETCPVSF